MSVLPGLAGANAACAAALVRALVQAHAAGDRPAAPTGPLHVVVSPGSRSTPLVLALAAHPGVRLHPVLDERAAAFVALGLAQASGRCVATLCTSGSAAAHALPAAIEAHHAGVPLLLLTADRPGEAQGVGAAQTTPQDQLYRDHARLVLQLPEPLAQASEDGEAAAADAVLRAWQSAGVRAVAASLGPWPGPVHLNLPFREPLGTVPADAAKLAVRLPQPPPVWHPAAPGVPTAAAAVALAQFLAGPGPGAIVCGAALPAAARPEPLARAVLELAAHCGWPVVAEGLSGVRFAAGVVPAAGGPAPHPDAVVCPAAQALVAAPALPRPQRVLRLGAAPLGRQTQALCTGPHVQAACLLAPCGTWADPQHAATLVLQAQPEALLAAVQHQITPPDDAQRAFTAAWQRASQACAAPASTAPTAAPWFEGSALSAALGALPPDACAVVGNSLAVRDLDEYCSAVQQAPTLYGRRGVSGIDGALAHLLGVGLAEPARVCVGLLGDCTFAYDLSTLAACAAAGARLVAVVFNNGGGEIFAQLPIAANEAVFEPYFRAPQHLDVRASCLAARAGYAHATDLTSLARAVAAACNAGPGMQVVEASFAPAEARAARRCARVTLQGRLADAR